MSYFHLLHWSLVWLEVKLIDNELRTGELLECVGPCVFHGLHSVHTVCNL